MTRKYIKRWEEFYKSIIFVIIKILLFFQMYEQIKSMKYEQKLMARSKLFA